MRKYLLGMVTSFLVLAEGVLLQLDKCVCVFVHTHTHMHFHMHTRVSTVSHDNHLFPIPHNKCDTLSRVHEF